VEHLNQSIAKKIIGLRRADGLTLAALAQRSGVSKSMISLIERAQISATAVVLDKLAAALGVPLASLFTSPQRSAEPISRHAEQVVWRDPETGYTRRTLSPPSFASPFQLTEVLFPAGARASYSTPGRSAMARQQIWLIEGAMEVTVGASTYRLEPGDCLGMVLTQGTSFYNPSRTVARYLVINESPLNGSRNED
jgi:transcriptional regulator with XRE-family HTH domain